MVVESLIQHPGDLLHKLKVLDPACLASIANRFFPANLRIQQNDFFARYDGMPDEFGFDLNAVKFWEPLFRFFYEDYFQVKVIGLENIPSDGPAILIGNHSGVLPIDALMLFESIYRHHSTPRRIRYLAHEWFNETPALKNIVCGIGAVPAKFTVAMQLLRDNELVFFYPEGLRGVSKPFSRRYQVMEFNPGFIKAAILSGCSIVPITTVGLDEIYPLIGTSPLIARLWGTPFFPLTITFPWLPFPASCIPLPIKTLIKIGKPIQLDYPPEKAGDRALHAVLAKEFKQLIQKELNILVSKRKSPFAGWDLASLEK
jgi:1-acyl-sn-glycerol-3-phosphate acyltransferase